MKKSKIFISLILIFSVICSSITVFGATDMRIVAPMTAKVKTVMSSDKRVPVLEVSVTGNVSAGDAFHVKVTDYSFTDGKDNVWKTDYGNGAFIDDNGYINPAYTGPMSDHAAALDGKVKFLFISDEMMIVEFINDVSADSDVRIPLFGKITGSEPNVHVDNNNVSVGYGVEKFIITEVSGFEIEVYRKNIGGGSYEIEPVYFREKVAGAFTGKLLTLTLDKDFVFEKVPVVELSGQLKNVNHSNPLIINKTRNGNITIQKNADFRTSSDKSSFSIEDLVIVPVNEDVKEQPVYLYFSGDDMEDGKIHVANYKIIITEPEEDDEEDITEPDNVIRIAFSSDLANEYYLNNEAVALDKPFYIENGRTMIPLRAASVMLGVSSSSITWNDETRTASIFKDGITYSVKVARLGEEPDKNLYVNGEAFVAMDTSPVIVDNSTYIPVAYFARFMDITYLWEQGTKTLYFNPNERIFEMYPDAPTNAVKIKPATDNTENN